MDLRTPRLPGTRACHAEPPLWRVLRVLAMTVVVLVRVRLAVPVLNPIFFAVVLALLFGPVYAWLDGVASPRRLRS